MFVVCLSFMAVVMLFMPGDDDVSASSSGEVESRDGGSVVWLVAMAIVFAIYLAVRS